MVGRATWLALLAIYHSQFTIYLSPLDGGARHGWLCWLFTIHNLPFTIHRWMEAPDIAGSAGYLPFTIYHLPFTTGWRRPTWLALLAITIHHLPFTIHPLMEAPGIAGSASHLPFTIYHLPIN